MKNKIYLCVPTYSHKLMAFVTANENHAKTYKFNHIIFEIAYKDKISINAIQRDFDAYKIFNPS